MHRTVGYPSGSSLRGEESNWGWDGSKMFNWFVLQAGRKGIYKLYCILVVSSEMIGHGEKLRAKLIFNNLIVRVIMTIWEEG